MNTRKYGARLKGVSSAALIALTGGGTVIGGGYAHAQTPASVDDSGNIERESVQEKVIVTANRRESNLQDVPIAVTAVSGEQILERGVYDLNDLSKVAPSLKVETTSSSATTTISIRGIGTAGLNPGFEAAVGTFVDGVYRSRSAHANGDLFDIERVEVLRGPQSTLFGKNTSAGVLNIITSKPEYEFGAGGRVLVGNDDLFRTDGYVTGPLIEDQLAFRVSASNQDRDGFIEDVVTGQTYNDRNRWSAKGQLLWEPSSDLSFRLIGDYRQVDEVCCVGVYDEVGPLGPLLSGVFGAFQPDGSFDAVEQLSGAYNTAPFESIEDSGVSLEANWDTELGEFTSITAFRRNTSDQTIDPDHSDANILAPLDQFERYNTFTQEVRLSGTWNSVDWLAGAFYFDENLSRGSELGYAADTGLYVSLISPFGEVPSDFPPVTATAERSRQDNDGWAIFTHNIIDVTDKATLTLGARYLKENKAATVVINDAPIDTFVDQPLCSTTFATLFLDVVCGNLSWDQTRSEDAVSGTASLSYAFSDNVNAYVSYSRGYKAGGFNLDRQAVQSIASQGGVLADSAQFDEETANAYDIGVKATTLNGRATVNGALFYTDYGGYQNFNFDGLRFFVDNLDKVISQGVEIESTLEVAEGISAYAGVTYAETKFDESLTPSPTVFPGKPLIGSPKWQGAAGFTIDRPVSSKVRALANVNVFFQGPVLLDRSPSQQNLYAVTNGQIGIANADNTVRFLLWSRNIFDERSKLNRFGTPFQGGNFTSFVGEPRTYGLSLEVTL